MQGTPVFSQTLSMGFGPVFTHTNQRVRMVNSKEDFMNTSAQWMLAYEHQLKSPESLSVSIMASKYEGATWMRFSEGSYIGSDGFPTLGVGFSGVNITRIDLQVIYNLFKAKQRFYVKPSIGLGVQVSKDLDYDFYNLEQINGPDYFQLAPIVAEAYNTVQVVPILGFKTGVVIWRRIEVGLNVQGVYGFKSYQDMFFDYSYRGEIQETAVFESKGTGVFAALSIGYRFKKQ
jgi:hypothetical protein